MHSVMAPQEWIYQLPYEKFLQSLIRSEEVMTSLSFLSFPMLLSNGNPGILCDPWTFLGTCPFTLSVLLSHTFFSSSLASYLLNETSWRLALCCSGKNTGFGGRSV